jgi:hypothetical protein
MAVEKSNESYTYDVEINEKHFTVKLETDCNIGYTQLTVFDEEGNQVKEGTVFYKQVISELDKYFETED